MANSRLSLQHIADRLSSELIAAEPTQNRVRLLFDETWGAPAVALAEVAYLDSTGAAVASSSDFASTGAASAARDGDAATYWQPNVGDLEQHIGASFATAALFRSVTLIRITLAELGGGWEHGPRAFRVQTSADGVTWTTVDTRTDLVQWDGGEVREFVVDMYPADDDDIAWERIGTSFDVDFAAVFRDSIPALWVLGQRTRALPDPHGYSEHGRQRMQVEIAMRLVLKRNIVGTFNNETQLIDAVNQIETALVGWVPTNAEDHLTLVSQQDGPVAESVITADLVFATTVIRTF